MIEQGKSEKAFNEMAEMVEVFTHGVCGTRQAVIDALKRGGYSDIRDLYEVGYRKSEEVQKETTKKIFKELRCHCMTVTSEDCNGDTVVPKSYTWWEDDLNELEKKFGVEVEE